MIVPMPPRAPASTPARPVGLQFQEVHTIIEAGRLGPQTPRIDLTRRDSFILGILGDGPLVPLDTIVSALAMFDEEPVSRAAVRVRMGAMARAGILERHYGVHHAVSYRLAPGLVEAGIPASRPSSNLAGAALARYLCARGEAILTARELRLGVRLDGTPLAAPIVAGAVVDDHGWPHAPTCAVSARFEEQDLGTITVYDVVTSFEQVTQLPQVLSAYHRIAQVGTVRIVCAGSDQETLHRAAEDVVATSRFAAFATVNGLAEMCRWAA